MAKPLPTQTTFANVSPPWSLTNLDGDFTNLWNAVNDVGTYSNVFTDTGAVNALIVTVPGGLTFSLVSGVTLTIIVANTTTSSAPTLNVNSTGAKNLVDNNGGLLIPGALIGGARYTVCYDGTSYRVLTFGTYGLTQTLTAPGGISTTETYLGFPLPIAANSLYPGSTFRFTIYGGAGNTSGSNTLTQRIRIGTTGTLSDPALNVVQAINVTGFFGSNYKTSNYVHFRTVGSSGTCFHEFDDYGFSTAQQTNQTVGIDAAGTTVNTTQALFIGITVQTSNALLSVANNLAMVERLY